MLKKSHEKKSHYKGKPTNTPVSLLLAARDVSQERCLQLIHRNPILIRAPDQIPDTCYITSGISVPEMQTSPLQNVPIHEKQGEMDVFAGSKWGKPKWNLIHSDFL